MTTFDMSESIQSRSDQINFDDFLSGAKVVTISGVRPGSAEQPVDFDLVEHPGKAYRPSKSMRRVMVSAWGKDASAYIGKRLELYGDPEVKFGAQKVGGIKIAKMSHIDRGFTINLTATRGKKDPHKVDVLANAAPPPTGNGITAKLIQDAGFENDDNGRADWLTFASNVAGRAINATKELTADEAAKVIAELGKSK
jgi:hypothetical protein